MKRFSRMISIIMAVALSFLTLCVPAGAKTNPTGQTVDTVLFYIRNSRGEDVLVSHVTTAQMEADLKAEKIDTQNHNYSLLDRYVTTVHQEAQGFTAPEFVEYMQSYSTVSTLQNAHLSFSGEDSMSFWEIDQSGYDELDSYTYNDLYGTARYNFPLLYEYWNYRTQDYFDPNGLMNRDEVIDHILQNGEPEVFLLSVLAFSQRYIVTDEKYGSGDYNMENLWLTEGKLDTERTVRMMMPMTEEDLRTANPTASITRYWCANIRLEMQQAPDIASLGKVEAPTATMTDDTENYYIRFACATPGATILFNHNYISPSYAPTCAYDGGTVTIPKSAFPGGTVTMTCRAVKDGYTDAGVITLKLESSGIYEGYKNPYSDVSDSAWYAENVQYVTENSLFDAAGDGKFSPEAPMTCAMLATALYRMAGSPKAAGITSTPFTDVKASAPYADAVAWCYSTGVVNGVTETTFVPDSSITREQIVTMFHRYAEKVAKADMSVSNDLRAFTDKTKLSSYAMDSMQWAVAAGLITGVTDTTIVPQGTATRAQTAAMVQRLAAFAG